MPDYHARFGGSNAKRWRNCTASTGLIALAPRPVTNRAAMEGTAQHSAMEAMLRNPDHRPEDFLGVTLDGVQLTQQHVDYIKIADDAATELLDEFDDDAPLYAEQFFTFLEGNNPAEPEAGGSCDLMIIGGRRALFADFKFGQIEVGAASDQNRFYMASAVRTLPELLRDVQIWDSVIIQPAFDPAIVRETYSRADVMGFALECDAAIHQSKTRPTFNEGEWCTYCPGAVICPAKTQRLATLAQTPNDVAGMAEWWTTYRELEPFAATIRAQLTHELEQGVTVPGYKLVARRTEPQWRDEEQASEWLRDHGWPPHRFMQMRPPSDFQDVPDDLIHRPPGGNTIAPASDTRPAVLARGALGAALRRLGR